MSRDLDRQLLAALAVLDDQASGRGVIVDTEVDVIGTAPTTLVLPTGSRPGTTALRITFTKRGRFGPHTDEAVAVRAPYNEHTADWVRALAEQLRTARGWDPKGWANRAAQLVAGDNNDAPDWDPGDEAGRLTDGN